MFSLRKYDFDFWARFVTIQGVGVTVVLGFERVVTGIEDVFGAVITIMSAVQPKIFFAKVSADIICGFRVNSAVVAIMLANQIGMSCPKLRFALSFSLFPVLFN